MQLNYINSAVDMILEDGRRAWWPPAFFDDTIEGPGVIKIPYWGNVKKYWAGPDLTEEEINYYKGLVWGFYLLN